MPGNGLSDWILFFYPGRDSFTRVQMIFPSLRSSCLDFYLGQKLLDVTEICPPSDQKAEEDWRGWNRRMIQVAGFRFF
jgi:hypothetical protein